MARRPRKSNAGFTLMELIIVMTLLAILGMTVTPVFRGSLIGARSDHAMRDLFAAMKGAQAGAITRAVEHRLYVAPEYNDYWIAQAVTDEDGYVDFEALSGRAGKVVRLPSSLLMLEPEARKGESRGEFYVSFFPSGACDVAAVLVAFADEDDGVYALETTGTRVLFGAPQS